MMQSANVPNDIEQLFETAGVITIEMIRWNFIVSILMIHQK